MSIKGPNGQSLKDKLLANYTPITETGCWIWDGAWNSNARGFIQIKGRSVRVHRLAYEVLVGPIPEGLHVLHTCDTPSCINPSHLWLGTHQDNMQDRVVKRRYKSKLSDSQLMDILNREGCTLSSLAKEFSIDPACVSRLKAGKAYVARAALCGQEV